MRALKFRHWYKGLLLNNVFIDQDGSLYPTKDSSGGNFVDYDFDIDCLQIITEQFTGLRDKNGVDIYAGDILEQNKIMYNDNDKIKRTIVFDKGSFLNGKDGVPLSIVVCHSFSPLVIGNIHQK